MWVYQNPAPLECLPDKNEPIRPGRAEDAFPDEKCPEQQLLPMPIRAEPSGKAFSESRSPTHICWLLVAAFLFGCMAAGILWAMYEDHLPDWIRFYLQSWQGMFRITDVHTAAGLFGTEYLTLFIAASVLLLAGFSALGPVLIFLFTMLYGLGSGILFVQMAPDPWSFKGILLMLLAALPAAASEAGLCFLGSDSLHTSSRIRAYSFFAPQAPNSAIRSGVLIRSYLLTVVLFLPLCGLSAGFSCIGSRL